MPRIVRTARGDTVDFDAILIKHQLSQAPMNIDVARRKQFIDSKEGKQPKPAVAPQPAAPVEASAPPAHNHAASKDKK